MQCEEGGRDAPSADAVEVKALDATAGGAAEVLAQVASLEKGIFPKHESMAGELEREVGKRNTTMLYVSMGAAGGGQERVAGYLVVQFGGLAANVTKLAVAEDRRRLGLGTALLSEALALAQKRRAACVRLHVETERKGAQALYKRMGFVEDTTIQDYYSKGRHAYRMMLEF